MKLQKEFFDIYSSKNSYNKIIIDNNNYNVGDKIYTSGLNNIIPNLLIGYVKRIETTSLYTIIDIHYIDLNNNYVVILK